jgi:hypothetical protein
MSGRQQRVKDYIRKVKTDLVEKGEWKTSTSACSFLNGVILCDHVLNTNSSSEPPFLTTEKHERTVASPPPPSHL